MFTRSAILVVATWLVFGAAIAEAKVSPYLDAQGSYEEQLLEKLIEDSSERQYCEVESTHGVAGAVTLISRMPFENGRNDACSIPGPRPDPFEDIARL